MAESNNHKSGYEKWQDYIDGAKGDSTWDDYDCEIQAAVNEFNNHLSDVAGYTRLDWHFIKAMIWVETGAKSNDWKTKPMQIGVTGDPGLSSLLSGNEGGDLILPPLWMNRLNAGSARTIPSYNIRAGIGYLLMRMANFDIKSVMDADNKLYEVVVKHGDSLDKIARTQGSAVEVMKKLNPTAHVLHPGQTLKYRKAAMKKVVIGWKAISTTNIAFYYNGNRDPVYAKKLDYALVGVRNRGEATCKQ